MVANQSMSDYRESIALVYYRYINFFTLSNQTSINNRKRIRIVFQSFMKNDTFYMFENKRYIDSTILRIHFGRCKGNI